jgi:tetratricopeptide (TPR) repeat protein
MDQSARLPLELTSLVKEGVSLVNKGDADAAKAIFDEILSLDPACAKALCGRGTAFRILGHIEEALRDYDAALAIEPKYARALFNRGLVRFEKGDTEEAFAELEKAIVLSPEPGFYYHRAQCFCRLKAYDKALSDMTACIELDHDKQSATICQRGTVLLELGRGEDAAVDFEEAIRRNPNEPQFYVWLAYALSSEKQHERAVSVLDKAIEIQGNHPDLLFRRGCALYCANDFEPAIRDYDKALQINGDAAEAYYWRGRASEQLRDYEAAIADFSEAIARNGNIFAALIARGKAFLDIDDSQNAIKDLSRAIEINPSKARPFVLRGRAWSREGDDGRALDDFNSALRSNPRNKKALRARSDLLAELGDVQRSEADLDTLDEVMMKSSKGETMAQRRTRISLLLSEHFDPLPLADLAITERQFPFRVRADLQRAVDRLFDQSTRIEQFCGVKKEYSYEGVSFSDLLFPTSHGPALAVPPEYEEVDIGEREPARCLKNALWLLAQDKLSLAAYSLMSVKRRFSCRELDRFRKCSRCYPTVLPKIRCTFFSRTKRFWLIENVNSAKPIRYHRSVTNYF